jgi:transposase
MATNYIGADVDSKMTDLAVERNQKIVQRYRVPTTIICLREVLGRIRGRKELAIEEGPMAHWLYRELRDFVDRIVICDPRRNAYIAKDGDKDDPIDAAKLAPLLRGGYLREVYHSDDDQRVVLKEWAGLYHDRVGDAVRQINKIRARCRMYGLRPPRGVLRNAILRADWLASLGGSAVRKQLFLLWIGLDAVLDQVVRSRAELSRLVRPYEIIRYWQELPGIGLIRAATLFAYLDTPWRFADCRKLWKYCGVGLERCSSGKDRYGKPKVGLLQLAWAVNKRLKDAVMGAAISAIWQGRNVFAYQYERLVRDGLTQSNARHTVARKMLTVMWGMWKSSRRFDERLV